MAQEEVEQWEWEEPELPRFQGKLVEIQGVAGTIEARGGDSVAPNGLCGRALWDEEHGTYEVRTFNGHQLDLPEANLQDFVRPKPDEGGFDYAWPPAGQEEEFSVRLADTIRKQGYAVVQMFEGDDRRSQAMRAARERPEWLSPKPEFEEAYLGRDASSKVSMIQQADSADAAIDHYDHQVKMVAAALYGVSEDFFGFRPDNYRSGTMVRMPFQSLEEQQAFYPGPLQQSDVDEGLVENHLDFVQRRRLCIMYVVESRGGTLEFHPREDLCQPDVLLPLSRDKIVVFRHDLMAYTYKPTSAHDLVVQSWFMEEQQQLRLDGFKGDQTAVQDALGLGGIPIDSDRQVHIMMGNCRMPGGTHQMDRYTAAFSQMIDAFIDMPSTRWDMEPYYNPDSEQFGAQGKSVTRHSGMLSDEELLCFDNKFFDISPEVAFVMAPSQRILMEISAELLHMVGFDNARATRGLPLGLTVGECALDFDPWHGYQVVPEAWITGQNNFGTSAARVAAHFGLSGPLQQVDTACSTTLVSHNMCHAMLRKLDNKGIDRMFSLGHQTLNMPFGFIGLSGAGMLGRTGRCLTFDNTANGMARAEGCGGLFLKATDDAQVISERLGVYVSSFINQDGRSASLTAPNGPSQQQCMRSSMKEGHLNPADMVVNENHGTGTALGDPIETGSVRSVFRTKGDSPIAVTSSKSNLGHQETTAGSNGLLRTLTTLLNGTIWSTVHVGVLNQHIELEGFPGCFPTENIDCNRDNNVGGLNSFGFGGTNARAELWAHALAGPRGDERWFRQIDKRHSRSMRIENIKQMDCVSVGCPKCAGPMCWLCGEALPLVPKAGKHHCSAVRDELASYEYCSNCYQGGYKHGGEALELPDLGTSVHLTGSWCGFAAFQEMETAGDGVYTADVVMGDTCMEEFHILLERDRDRAIFPVLPRAGSRACIAGPSRREAGQNWLIDGRKDGAQTGSIYRVRLEWLETQKKISWQKLENKLEVESVGALHSYSILSSLAGFRPVEMQRDRSDPLSWEFTSKFMAQEELFMFQRDRDPKQLIYPLENRPADSSVPVVGPDAGTGVGKDMKLWSVRGKPGDIVIIKLQVRDGDIKVTAISEGRGQATWHNAHGGARNRYCVKSSWSKQLQEMEPDMADLDVCRLHFALPSVGYEAYGTFQILVNGDERKILHPGHPNAAPGQSLMEGPDADGRGLSWEVRGPPGQVFELSLDLGAEDDRKTVTCRPFRQIKSLPDA